MNIECLAPVIQLGIAITYTRRVQRVMQLLFFGAVFAGTIALLIRGPGWSGDVVALIGLPFLVRDLRRKRRARSIAPAVDN